jgi:hypothetical protein
MLRFDRWSALALVLCAGGLLAGPLSAPLAAQAKLPDDSVALGRQWSTWFLTGRADSLASRMSAEVLQAHGGVSGIIDAQAMVAERAGLMKSVMEEKFVWRNGRRQYWRTMVMSVLPEPFVLRFVMGEDGRIVGVGLGPLSAAPPVDSSGPPLKP